MSNTTDNTVGYYLAQGYSQETAEALAGTSTERTPSHPKLVIATDDSFPDIGIPKGTFVSGYVYDKQSLSFTTEGINHGKSVEAIILATAYQFSKFDGSAGNTFSTPIFKNPFDAKKVRDKKTGLTKDEAIAKGIRPVFQQILLTLVKVGGEYKPFLIYLANTRRFKFIDRLKELGLPNYGICDRLVINTKKVGSGADGKGIPSVIYNVDSVTKVSANENTPLIPTIESAIKAWSAWIKASEASEVPQSTSSDDNYNPFDY